MNSMFFDCESLISLNLSNFNTQNANKMNSIFFRCSSLIDIELPKFNSQNLENMLEEIRFLKKFN